MFRPKKIFLLLLSAFLSISVMPSNIVQASAVDPKMELTEEKNGIYYDYINDAYVTNLYIVENGVEKQITFDQYMDSVKNYKNIINENKNSEVEFVKNNNGDVITRGEFTLDTFEKKYEKQYLNYSWERRVSPEAEARYNNEVITVGQSYTFTRSFNVNLSAKKQWAVEATLSGGYARSVSNSEHFSVTQTVPKGYAGAVYFTPRVLEAGGDVVTTLWDSDISTPLEEVSRIRNVVALYPLKVSNYADGVYYTKLRKL